MLHWQSYNHYTFSFSMLLRATSDYNTVCTKPATQTSLLMQTLQRKDDSLCFESPSEELVFFLPTGESPGCSNYLLKICLVTIPHSFPKWRYPKLGECLKSRFHKFSSCLQAPPFQMLPCQTSLPDEGSKADLRERRKTSDILL